LTPLSLGFIGLGAMGAPMAESLGRAGHALRIHDIRKDLAAPLVANGALWTESPEEAARGVDVLFTCLPGPAQVEAVALGQGGLLAGMHRGSAWFDLSTNAPDLMRRLHATFAAAGVDVLDAPVSGGPGGAASRQLAIWVGGEAAVFDRHESLLRTMGDEAMYVGPIGSGSVAKLAHNCANISVQIALAEAFTMGVAAGLDPLVLFKALRQGTTGRSRTFDRLAEQFLPGRYDPPAFALELAHKDMSLALSLARAHGVPMQVADIAMQELEAALQRGWGQRDARIALTLQEERAKVSAHIDPQQLRDALE
jgi:3-hydroxyisobutyrate dehydrogenase